MRRKILLAPFWGAVTIIMILADSQLAPAQGQQRRTGLCQPDCLSVLRECLISHRCVLDACATGDVCDGGRCRSSRAACGIASTCAAPCILASANCRAGCQDYFPGLPELPGQLRLSDEVIKELMGDVLAAEQAIEKVLQTVAPQARPYFEKMKARVDEFESRGVIDAPTALFLKEEIARADASLSIENLRRSIAAGYAAPVGATADKDRK
jgi:hypothetical protein